MSAASTATPLLAVEGIRVRYRNGALGVLDVSLAVRAGQMVGLFGPNGAGKTTTVRAIGGFLRTEKTRVVAGTITIDGQSTTDAEPDRVAALGVTLVPERDKVFPNLTVAENLVALGTLPRRAERARALDRVQELFPVLAEKRGLAAGRLSGGQRQMLAIGRGLMMRPRLLIVDEMTLGLHHSVHPVLFDAVRSIAADGTAVLVVDESSGFALEAADHCYRLGGGFVRATGPPADFVRKELLMAGDPEVNGEI